MPQIDFPDGTKTSTMEECRHTMWPCLAPVGHGENHRCHQNEKMAGKPAAVSEETISQDDFLGFLPDPEG